MPVYPGKHIGWRPQPNLFSFSCPVEWDGGWVDKDETVGDVKINSRDSRRAS